MRILLSIFSLVSYLCSCISISKNPKTHNDLVDIHSICPDIVIDMRYATTNNFTGKRIYQSDICYLHKDAAIKLAQVQNELKKQGLGLKVFDCHRPLKAQELFWELVPDERYVSNPKKGSRHTKGPAVDLSLVDSKGVELEMPSGFDDFSEKAHRDFSNASAEAIKNRTILQEIMEKNGFEGLATEWWHFDLKDYKKYPDILLEIP